MSTSPNPARRLTLAEARETPCFTCAGAPCCTHLPLHRFQIRTLVDLEHARYLLNFERIELGLAASGEWSVFYYYPCRFLETTDPANYLCSIHGSDMQPGICVHYSPYSCWYKSALGEPPGDFIRIDRRRLDWITERVVFDERRTVVEVPGWPELAAMADALPLDTEPSPPPAPDPIFERWLEESATNPGAIRPPALRTYRDFLDSCSGCEAYCCTTLVFPHGRPQSRRNLDYLQFALGFPGVEVGVSDGEWQMVIKTRCRHLTAEHRCSAYDDPTRSTLCRYYDGSACTYASQFGATRPAGLLRIQLEQFYWLAESVRFHDDGTIVTLPPVDKLRAQVELRWSEAVAAQVQLQVEAGPPSEVAVTCEPYPPEAAAAAGGVATEEPPPSP